MPKGGGGRNGGRRGYRSYGARARLRNPPEPVSQSLPPAARRNDDKPAAGGLGRAVAEGFSFGSGMAMANRAMDAVFGPRVIHHETVAASAAPAAAIPAANTSSIGDACGVQAKAFQDCLSKAESDMSKCQFYMDILRECQGVKEPGAIF